MNQSIIIILIISSLINQIMLSESDTNLNDINLIEVPEKSNTQEIKDSKCLNEEDLESRVDSEINEKNSLNLNIGQSKEIENIFKIINDTKTVKASGQSYMYKKKIIKMTEEALWLLIKILKNKIDTLEYVPKKITTMTEIEKKFTEWVKCRMTEMNNHLYSKNKYVTHPSINITYINGTVKRLVGMELLKMYIDEMKSQTIQVQQDECIQKCIQVSTTDTEAIYYIKREDRVEDTIIYKKVYIKGEQSSNQLSSKNSKASQILNNITIRITEEISPVIIYCKYNTTLKKQNAIDLNADECYKLSNINRTVDLTEINEKKDNELELLPNENFYKIVLRKYDLLEIENKEECYCRISNASTDQNVFHCINKKSNCKLINYYLRSPEFILINTRTEIQSLRKFNHTITRTVNDSILESYIDEKQKKSTTSILKINNMNVELNDVDTKVEKIDKKTRYRRNVKPQINENEDIAILEGYPLDKKNTHIKNRIFLELPKLDNKYMYKFVVKYDIIDITYKHSYYISKITNIISIILLTLIIIINLIVLSVLIRIFK